MTNDPNLLRIHLDLLETERENVNRLLDRAATNEKLDRFSGSLVIEVETATGRITNANDIACELLGYTLDEMRLLYIADLEVILEHISPLEARRYFETTIETFVYNCYFRQQDGRLTPVRVRKRVLTHTHPPITHYALEDLSLRQRVWQELNRRENSDFQYRERMKALNRINAELGISESIDEICRLAVKRGTELLGFDRLSIWMYDSQENWMYGTYGVDEHGKLRDERAMRWPVGHSPVIAFTYGRLDPIVTPDSAPIYNNQSEIIGFGWHIAAPLTHEGRFIGQMTADNYLNGHPMKNYEPEILRSFAASVGHFCAHQHARDAAQEMAESARKLADAMRLKQERIQMLGTFITRIGHDFRTPLTLINTNTYLLRKTSEEERKINLAQNIEQQVDYINRVVKQMLEVVTLEEQVIFDFKPVDIGEALNNVTLFIAGMAAEKNIEFVFQDPPAVDYLADATWLERALRELLLNAVQFTEPGGHVTVNVLISAQELVIRIKDTGIGIAPEEHEKIFQHLYRVNSARTTPGVGLGLTLAKLIVEAHNGHIRLESALGKGSTFSLVLPRPALSANVETRRVRNHSTDTEPLDRRDRF